MKRSQQLALLATLCVLSGLLLGFAWLIFSLAIGGELLMNGPWFIALLITGLGASLAFASAVAEGRERLAERTRQIALQRAVANGTMTINEARREMGLPEYKRGQK